MVTQAYLFGAHLSAGFHRPPNHSFTVADGAYFDGDLRRAGAAMRARGFAPVSTDRFCRVFSDGRSLFRLVEGMHCGALGNNAWHQVLKQVWQVGGEG